MHFPYHSCRCFLLMIFHFRQQYAAAVVGNTNHIPLLHTHNAADVMCLFLCHRYHFSWHRQCIYKILLHKITALIIHHFLCFFNKKNISET